VTARRRRPQLNEQFVPVPREAVYTVTVDGEAVVLDQDTGRLHLLNATGALVWACFDGESSIEDIVADLSAELGVAADVALHDVLTIARQLGDQGLLANVEPRSRAPASGRGPEGPRTEPSADPRFIAQRPDP
jgi:hypothetical protein